MAGKVEKWVRDRVLGPEQERRDLSDEEIRKGTEQQGGGK